MPIHSYFGITLASDLILSLRNNKLWKIHLPEKKKKVVEDTSPFRVNYLLDAYL